MSKPILSKTLSEFWGKRWNLGFRQLAHDFIFRPLYKRIGVAAAGLLVFVVSGLIHDLVISLPARGGYGLPTAYFMLQGLGVTLERSASRQAARSAEGTVGWIFMVIVTAAPAFWLFHPPFVCVSYFPSCTRCMRYDAITLAERLFDLILWLAGAGHFVILFASAQVPSRLRWKAGPGASSCPSTGSCSGCRADSPC